jgi:hypothetical protein
MNRELRLAVETPDCVSYDYTDSTGIVWKVDANYLPSYERWVCWGQSDHPSVYYIVDRPLPSGDNISEASLYSNSKEAAEDITRLIEMRYNDEVEQCHQS